MELSMITFLCILLGYAVYKYFTPLWTWRTRARGRPLPPGPPRIPVLGSIFHLPTERPWEAFKQLSQIYKSDIIYFDVLGQPIVVLGSAAVIEEVMEKRSATTSDRKDTPLLELLGAKENMAFMPYGPRWRRHRRVFWSQFHPGALERYEPIQRAVVRKFLARLVETPARFEEHLRYIFAAATMKIIYDIDVADEDDKYIALIDNALEGITEGFVPGRFLVEFFPFLRHVPGWLPGTGFQQQLATWRAAITGLTEAPFAQARAAMNEGNASDSMISRLLAADGASVDDEGAESTDYESIVKHVASTTFEGGAETTYSALLYFLLAMSLYPKVQGKAQAELDEVVGPSRLPDCSDRDALVYVQALIKETLRWQLVAPLSIPHTSTVDDELDGYFIPAGTIYLPNTWACMHDPEVYEDPDSFIPERFIRDDKLDPAVRDPVNFAFGYGRRICPGRHFALESLLLTIASILHVFTIGPPLDENGRPIKVVPRMTGGLGTKPEDYRCRITPRSPEARALVEEGAHSLLHTS